MADNADNNLFRFMHLRSAVSPSARGDTEAARVERRGPRTDAGGVASGDVGLQRMPGVERERRLIGVKRELEGLHPRRDFVWTARDGAPAGAPALTPEAVQELSESTRTALHALGLALDHPRIDEVMAAVDGELSPQPPSDPGEPPSPSQTPARLHSVGVADLLVVKQQIKRYEPGEIAHIENVMAGEGKVRMHRQLDRTEEVVDTIDDREHDKESEFETTERFELHHESSRTQHNDQKTGFGLSISGKYGPTVEFNSKLDVSSQTSAEAVARNATSYAKDVVERSKERLVERVREERRTTTLREVEETNEHRLTNTTGEHLAGIYQFVDKVYESQVFNYGLRQMFDLMIPEPASYLWHLEKMPQPNPEMPVPPIRLEVEAPDASHINESNYLRLAARYGAKGIVAPPPFFVIKSATLTQGVGDDSESDYPRSRNQVDLDIPPGYRPAWALVTVMGVTDADPRFVFGVGSEQQEWSPPPDEERIDIGGGLEVFHPVADRLMVFPIDSGLFAADAKLPLVVFARETANYTLHAKVTFQRQSETLMDWSRTTFEAITEAYTNVLLRYQQEVETLKQHDQGERGLELDVGNPPSVNSRIIRTELKKHCLALLRNEHVGLLNTDHTTGGAIYPPYFDLEDAKADGAIIRFLEHAFEWDQVQYVFYPYFWGRPGGWADRFHARNMDPDLEEFLKAGYARVVLPVRSGFEAAVSYFMQSGEIWNGEGEPEIDDPLYKPIVDEIKERTGGTLGEVTVGDPWETRLPTAAVLVRQGHSLPEWERVPPDQWSWEPKV
jgi:hypothetical protein